MKTAFSKASHKTNGKTNREPVWQDIRKAFIRSLGGQKPMSNDEPMTVRYIIFGNFLYNDHTRVLISKMCQGVDWSSLGPNEWVLFLNLALTRASLIRLTPGGNVMGIHTELHENPQTSLIDLAAAIGEKDLRVLTDRRKKPLESITTLKMRKQDLALHLEKSKAKTAGWIDNSRLFTSVLKATKVNQNGKARLNQKRFSRKRG